MLIKKEIFIFLFFISFFSFELFAGCSSSSPMEVVSDNNQERLVDILNAVERFLDEGKYDEANKALKKADKIVKEMNSKEDNQLQEALDDSDVILEEYDERMNAFLEVLTLD